MKTPVVAIFDIGKTNKKLLLFDEQYTLVYEESVRIAETVDEDGDPCEDLEQLSAWVRKSLLDVLALPLFEVRGLNFSAYGASLVHLDAAGNPITPLYNYLKPYPTNLKKQFFAAYGDETRLSIATASPILDSLNSGLALYRLKHQRPGTYSRITTSLHLPQYLSFLVTGKAYSDLTSIGCHTLLWDFQEWDYHEWVIREGLNEKLAPIFPSTAVVPSRIGDGTYPVGTGLHDSSAALIPYLISFRDPFLLLSTGTWCISLNPFSHASLNHEDLEADCLNYLHYRGQPVKASRVFAGHEHEYQTKRLADHFHTHPEAYKHLAFNPEFIVRTGFDFQGKSQKSPDLTPNLAPSPGLDRLTLPECNSYEEAYHRLVQDLVCRQRTATERVLHHSGSSRLFVDGGFSQNRIYMAILAASLPQIEVFAATMAQATALGAALAIHAQWNRRPVPENLIDLKHYASVVSLAA